MTKKKRTNLTLKKPNLLLFQGSRPPCFFVGFSVLFSLQPATTDFPSPRRFTISFPSPQLPNTTSSLSATTDFPSPFSLHLCISSLSPWLLPLQPSPKPSSLSPSPTHGQAGHYSSNNPSSPPKTETGRPFAFGFFFFQQRRRLPVQQHRLPPTELVTAASSPAPPPSGGSSSSSAHRRGAVRLLPPVAPADSASSPPPRQTNTSSSAVLLPSLGRPSRSSAPPPDLPSAEGAATRRKPITDPKLKRTDRRKQI